MHIYKARTLTPPRPTKMQNVQKHEKPLMQSWWCEFHQLWEGTNMKGKGLLSNVKFKNELRQKKAL
jgi:hypothetical protein